MEVKKEPEKEKEVELETPKKLDTPKNYIEVIDLTGDVPKITFRKKKEPEVVTINN